jgi:hypothetical protein
MFFCKNLGNKLTVGAFSMVTPDQIKENSMSGQIAQANVEMQASWKDPPKNTEQPKKKSKLLLIAIIVAPVLWLVFITVIVIGIDRDVKGRPSLVERYEMTLEESIKNMSEEDKNTIREKEKETIKKIVIEEKASEKRAMMIMNILLPFGGLLILAIPTLLTIIGERKNKRKMILAAGIVYIFTGVGIPSAVMCFIANAKMKKQE